MHDDPGELTGGGGLDSDVEEPGSGDVDGLDALGLAEAVGDCVGHVAGRGADLLGDLHGDV